MRPEGDLRMSPKSSTFALAFGKRGRKQIMMNDTLYNALQGFEMRLAMQHNRWVEMPCRQIVRTSIQVASQMLSDEAVEHNRDTYLCLINRLMDGSQQERMMVLIVTIALLGRLDSPHARRCRNTLRVDACEDFEEYLSLYEQFLKSSDTTFAEEDFLIDTHTAISRLQTEKQHLITENEQLKKTIHTMSKEKTIIHVAGNYIAEQNIDIHDNQNVYLGGTAPSSLEQKEQTQNEKEQANVEDITPVETSETLFCRITQAAYDKGKAQQVEAELKSACTSAPKLVKAIRTNEALGYLDTKNLSSVELYNLLNEHFGLTFRVRTFQNYRSK